MKTYLEAYHERKQKNEQSIFNFSKVLKENGFTVLVTERNPDRFISNCLITKGNKSVSLQFCEVPYRWSLSISWKPNKDNGSGKTVLVNYNLEKVLFSMNEIETHLYPNYESLEKMYSWTRLINIENHIRFN